MTVELILYRVAEGGPFDIQVDNGVVIENITDDLVNAKILIPVGGSLYRRQCADGAACNDGLSAPYPHVAACFVMLTEENL